MNRFAIVTCVAVAVGLASAAAQASVTINFDAVSLRGANVGTHVMPSVTEYGNGNGMHTGDLVAGQKVYYGTNFFNGLSLIDLDGVTFYYKPSVVGSPAPYLNLQVQHTDGGGVLDGWGVIAFGSPSTSVPQIDDPNVTYVGYDLSTGAGFAGFYEGVGVGATAKPTSWSDAIDDGWTLLGVGESRVLKSGEGDVPNARAPITDALAIIWGDSAANYLGTKDIYDVTVGAWATSSWVDESGFEYFSQDLVQYQAGNVVPEPATIIVWSLLGCLGIAIGLWRRKRAA